MSRIRQNQVTGQNFSLRTYELYDQYDLPKPIRLLCTAINEERAVDCHTACIPTDLDAETRFK